MTWEEGKFPLFDFLGSSLGIPIMEGSWEN